MDIDLSNLRPLCMAIAASDFSPGDRLKAIVQVAYEVLGASSIIAYKYDRLSERLLIFAMPGVVEREIMRGPTPESIFIWEEVSSTKPPQGKWMENQQEFDAHLAELSKRYPSPGRSKRAGEDFRTREKRKHGGGDLALAKICLFKGEGQTLDKVGQLFFNFHTISGKHTFTAEMRSAIAFVSKLVREFLIEELYHTGKTQTEAPHRGAARSLHLLRVIDEKLKPAANVTLNSVQDLDANLIRRIKEYIGIRIKDLQKEERVALSDFVKDLRATAQKNLVLLLDYLEGKSIESGQGNDLEVAALFRDILPQALSRELWRLVCRAALEIVETYGGQADIILILGERIGRRIQPIHVGSGEEEAYLWLDSQTVTGDCIERGKVFACNNVPEKSSDESKERFAKEPSIEQFKSLLVVPVAIEGEVRAVVRMMSTDENCFLDKHTQAIEDLAFVTSYALNVLDSRQRRDRITDALAYFAEGQAVAEQHTIEELLKKSLRVLGAEFAVFWPVEAIHQQQATFRQGAIVNAFGSSQHITATHKQLGIRDKGFTQRVFQIAEKSHGH